MRVERWIDDGGKGAGGMESRMGAWERGVAFFALLSSRCFLRVACFLRVICTALFEEERVVLAGVKGA